MLVIFWQVQFRRLLRRPFTGKAYIGVWATHLVKQKAGQVKPAHP